MKTRFTMNILRRLIFLLFISFFLLYNTTKANEDNEVFFMPSMLGHVAVSIDLKDYNMDLYSPYYMGIYENNFIKMSNGDRDVKIDFFKISNTEWICSIDSIKNSRKTKVYKDGCIIKDLNELSVYQLKDGYGLNVVISEKNLSISDKELDEILSHIKIVNDYPKYLNYFVEGHKMSYSDYKKSNTKLFLFKKIIKNKLNKKVSPYFEDISNIDIINNYYKLGEFKRALDFSKKSIEKMKAYDMPKIFYNEYYGLMAKIEYKLNNYHSVKYYLEKAMKNNDYRIYWIFRNFRQLFNRRDFVDLIKKYHPDYEDILKEYLDDYHLNDDVSLNTSFPVDGISIVKNSETMYHVDKNHNKFYLPIYKKVNQYSEGKAVVTEDFKNYFYINLDGFRVDNRNYDMANDYSEGIALVVEDGHFFYIDENGNRLYKTDYLDASDFYEGRAAVKDENGWFYINKNGMKVTDDTYLSASDYAESTAIVSVYDKKTAKVITYHIDINGNRLYKKNYKTISNFKDGASKVIDFDDKQYFINKKGINILNEEYTPLEEDFLNGALIVRDKFLNYFHINNNGERIYEENYDYLFNYDNSIDDYRKTNKKGKIYRENGFGINFPWHVYILDNELILVSAEEGINYIFLNKRGDFFEDSYFSRFLAYFDEDERCWEKVKYTFDIPRDAKIAYLIPTGTDDISIVASFDENLKKIILFHVDKKGKPLYKRRFSSLSAFYEGKAIASTFNEPYNENHSSEKLFYIDKQGKRLFKDYYSNADDFKDGYAIVEKDGETFYINSKGEKAFNHSYKKLTNYSEGVARVIDNGGSMFHINKKGERLYPQQYNWVGEYKNGFAVVRDKNKNRFHINKKGERLYKQNYKWISNFEDGIAVVQDKNAYMFHIKINGMSIGKDKFIYVKPFVEDRAVVKDDEGMFHINKKGNRYYSEKYQYVMDYSNGVAEVYDGKNWKKININGNLIEEDFSDSEGMGVYWRQAIGPGQMPCASVLLGDVPLSDHPECAEMQKDLENSISR